VRSWSELLQFDKIKLVTADKWPERWLSSGVPPGTLLLRDGLLGETGGLLRLTREGTFVTVTSDEIFRESVIVWPGANPEFYGIRLKGVNVEIVMVK
jgi:hypothetical protein